MKQFEILLRATKESDVIYRTFTAAEYCRPVSRRLVFCSTVTVQECLNLLSCIHISQVTMDQLLFNSIECFILTVCRRMCCLTKRFRHSRGTSHCNGKVTRLSLSITKNDIFTFNDCRTMYTNRIISNVRFNLI